MQKSWFKFKFNNLKAVYAQCDFNDLGKYGKIIGIKLKTYPTEVLVRKPEELYLWYSIETDTIYFHNLKGDHKYVVEDLI